MTIIKSNKIINKKTINASIDGEVHKEIQQYCEWAGIFDLGYFIEDIAKYIFRKDKDWQAYKEEQAS